jgi:hypothetical protein
MTDPKEFDEIDDRLRTHLVAGTLEVFDRMNQIVEVGLHEPREISRDAEFRGFSSGLEHANAIADPGRRIALALALLVVLLPDAAGEDAARAAHEASRSRAMNGRNSRRD